MALRGVKVLEFAGLAPGPHCGMILADFGASVTRIDKVNTSFTVDSLSRGKRSVSLDIRKKEGQSIIKTMTKKTDVIIDPFRPGVLEKLGLGPDSLTLLNKRLIFARLTGFGQNGPLSNRAGHDINYLATSGVLSRLVDTNKRPQPPINLIADFAGGGLSCALAIVMALYHRTMTSKGTIIDCSMTEGAAYLSSFFWSNKESLFSSDPGDNLLDGGCPHYGVFETSDGKHVAVGSLEPKFLQELLLKLDIPFDQYAESDPEVQKQLLSDKFLSQSREYWTDVFSGSDACVSPILSLDEAPKHEHNIARKTFFRDENGSFQPTPAPRLSGNDEFVPRPRPGVGEHTLEVLLKTGYSQEEVNRFVDKGVVSITNHTSKL